MGQAVPAGDGERVASWQERAVARSVEAAQRRAVDRQMASAQRIVAAAFELVVETGGCAFTVKQVSERAGVALMTLYRYFETKDHLLLAVLEEACRMSAAKALGDIDGERDPLERLRRVVIRHAVQLSPDAPPHAHAFAREQFRLMDEFPHEYDRAIRPYRDVLLAVMRDAAEAGVIAPGDVERDATVVETLVTSLGHRSLAGATELSPDELADWVWDFCLAALRRGNAPAGRRARPRSR